MSITLRTCVRAAMKRSRNPREICGLIETELRNHGIRVGVTTVVILYENEPHAKGHIVDISFSKKWGFYAVFIGTLFSGGNGNCFIADCHAVRLEILN